jgi:hypothetical protein
VFRETERVTPLELFFDPRLRPGDHTVHRADGRRTDLGGGRPRRPVVVLGLAGGTAIGVSGGGPTRDHVPRGYRGATPEGAMMGVTSVGHARCARPQFINPCGEARCSLLVGYGTADCFATRADASPGAGWRAGGLRVRARGPLVLCGRAGRRGPARRTGSRGYPGADDPGPDGSKPPIDLHKFSTVPPRPTFFHGELRRSGPGQTSSVSAPFGAAAAMRVRFIKPNRRLTPD